MRCIDKGHLFIQWRAFVSKLFLLEKAQQFTIFYALDNQYKRLRRNGLCSELVSGCVRKMEKGD